MQSIIILAMVVYPVFGLVAHCTLPYQAFSKWPPGSRGLLAALYCVFWPITLVVWLAQITCKAPPALRRALTAAVGSTTCLICALLTPRCPSCRSRNTEVDQEHIGRRCGYCGHSWTPLPRRRVLPRAVVRR